jgi:hypothetical protein
MTSIKIQNVVFEFFKWIFKFSFFTLHYQKNYNIQCNYENKLWIKLNNEMKVGR